MTILSISITVIIVSIITIMSTADTLELLRWSSLSSQDGAEADLRCGPRFLLRK